jgi:hypothetical protein
VSYSLLGLCGFSELDYQGLHREEMFYYNGMMDNRNIMGLSRIHPASIYPTTSQLRKMSTAGVPGSCLIMRLFFLEKEVTVMKSREDLLLI